MLLFLEVFKRLIQNKIVPILHAYLPINNAYLIGPNTSTGKKKPKKISSDLLALRSVEVFKGVV